MSVTIWEALAVFAAGIGAGTINTIVGSGTLITFPVLLAVGLPPVTANVSNALGLVPGSISGAIGYRRELAGQRGRLLRLGIVASLGGAQRSRPAGHPALQGLRRHRAGAHRRSPWSWSCCSPGSPAPSSARRERNGTARPPTAARCCSPACCWPASTAATSAPPRACIYLSLMGLLLDDTLQRINAVKNVLAAVVNGIAAVFFLFVADFDWAAVLLIAVGCDPRRPVGARVGRRLPPAALRALIVVVGIAAIVQLVLK